MITFNNISFLVLFGRDSLLLCTFTIVLTVILKNMIQASDTSPTWVSSLVSIVQNNRPGQFLLLYDTSFKVCRM